MEAMQSKNAVSTAVPCPGGGRIVYLDVLRIIALFFVMQIHVISDTGTSIVGNSFDATVSACYDMIARVAVPLLFMISGTLFLNPSRPVSWARFYRKNLLRLITAYLFWSVIYAVMPESVFPHLPSELTLRTLVVRIVQGPYHFWFLMALIGLYLITPFMRCITASRRMTEYFLVLWFLFGLMLPALDRQALLNETIHDALLRLQIGFVVGLPGYYILGYYLSAYEWKPLWRIILYVFGFGCMLAMLLLRVSKSIGSPLEPLALNIALPSASCFVACKRAFRNRCSDGKACQALKIMSMRGFGAYLVHPLVIWLVCVPVGLSIDRFSPLLSIPAASATVFAASFAISCLLNQIPYIRRYIV